MARNFNTGDAALTETIREGQAKIFGEDLGDARIAAAKPLERRTGS